MLFLFGTRASKIKTVQLQGQTQCPHCESQNSFIATTYARYFHVFWIPFFPLLKSTILECSHCKKSYDVDGSPESVKAALSKTHELDAPKRPIWHGCGCLILVAIIAFSMISGVIGYIFNKDEIDKENSDVRKEYLEEAIRKATSKPTIETDSISFYLKTCVSLSLEGIDMDEIEYYSKVNSDKLLVILKVSDIKKIQASSRKELVYAVDSCIDDFLDMSEYSKYIGVDGNWNMLMVKTPNGSDLGGKFADKKLLLPFYNEEVLEKTDTTYIVE